MNELLEILLVRASDVRIGDRVRWYPGGNWHKVLDRRDDTATVTLTVGNEDGRTDGGMGARMTFSASALVGVARPVETTAPFTARGGEGR